MPSTGNPTAHLKMCSRRGHEVDLRAGSGPRAASLRRRLQCRIIFRQALVAGMLLSGMLPSAPAQTWASEKTIYRFDFSAGKVGRGWIPVRCDSGPVKRFPGQVERNSACVNSYSTATCRMVAILAYRPAHGQHHVVVGGRAFVRGLPACCGSSAHGMNSSAAMTRDETRLANPTQALPARRLVKPLVCLRVFFREGHGVI